MNAASARLANVLRAALGAAAVALLALRAAATDPVPLQPLTALLPPQPMAHLTLTDVDGDGLLDAVGPGGSSFSYDSVIVVRPAPGLETGPTQVISGLPFMPQRVAAGDFDGDGDTDLAVTTTSGLTVVDGAGDGTFLPPATHLLLPDGGDRLALADFDADGNLDLAISPESWLSNVVNVVRGQGDGTFALVASIPTASNVLAMDAGDVTGDGHTDFAAGGDGVVGLVPGLGDGSFGPPSFVSANTGTYDLVLRDLNGDDLLDLAVAGSSLSPVAWRLNLGGGILGPQKLVPGMLGSAVSMDAGDLDDDGDVDLAVLGGPCRFVRNDGTGALSFTPGDEMWALYSQAVVRVGDVDGDGRTDVSTLAFSGYAAFIVLARATPDGGLDVPAMQPVAPQSAPLALLDVTADGLVDALLQNSSMAQVQPGLGDGLFGASIDSTTSTFNNYTRYHAPGDFDGDGQTDLLVTANSTLLAGPTALRLAWGLGDGHFVPDVLQAEAPTGQYGNPSVLDYDLDGDLDGVTSLDSQVVLVPNDGSGVLGPAVPLAVPYVVANFEPPGTGDVEGDGLPDIVVSNGVDVLDVFHGTGAGAFSAPEAVSCEHATPRLADLDGDGRDEIVASHFVGPLANPDITLLKHDPAGGWDTLAAVVLPTEVLQHEVADLTGDGVPDVFVGGFEHWYALPGVGDGTLAPTLTRACAGQDFLVGDVDGDGLADVTSFKTFVSSDGIPQHLGVARTRPHGPWIVHDLPLAGSAGEPHLKGLGTLVGGTPVALRLTDAKPGAAAVLCVGFTTIYAPFKGGTLVPNPDALLGPFATDIDGNLLLPGTWPPGLPARLSITIQAWIADAAGPKGWAASGGLEAVTP